MLFCPVASSLPAHATWAPVTLPIAASASRMAMLNCFISFSPPLPFFETPARPVGLLGRYGVCTEAVWSQSNANTLTR
jgi:hypothetical protein